MRDGWTSTTLGEIAEWRSGGTPKAGDKRFYGGGIPWAVIGDLHDGPVVTTASTITEAGLAEIGGRLAPSGSVLISMYGTIGRLGRAMVPMATNQAIAWAEPIPELVDARFLLYLLLNQRADLDARARGATQRNINREILRSWPVQLPPLAEQRRIVDLVTHADDCPSRAERVRLASAAVLDAWVERAAADASRSVNRPIGEVLRRVRRPVSVEPDRLYREIGIRSHGKGIFHKPPVLGSDLGNKKVFSIEPGDLVFNIVFAWEGAVALAGNGETGRIGSHRFPTYRPDPALMLGEYAWALMRSARGRQYLNLASPGSAGRNRTLNQGVLTNFAIPVPTITAQMEYVDVLHALQDALLAATALCSTIENTRQSVLRHLLSGQHVIPESYDRVLEAV